MNVPDARPVIELRGVWKLFGERAEPALSAIRRDGLDKAQVLQRFGCVVGVADVSFTVRAGEIFCVMGLSGSGKSTLVRHMNRLVEPTAGTVRVIGRDVGALGDAALRAFRARHIGMVFQHMALLPHRSVWDNVAFPLEVRGEPKYRRWEISQRALALVNLEGYEDRMPRELSGGMQQRVGLARAVASDPAVLLMDEPFSALDPLIRRRLQSQFPQMTRTLRKTTVFITHDLEEAIRVGDRIAIMKDGRIVQVGTPGQIVLNPQDDYVADFVRHISKLNLVSAASIMEAIEPDRPPADAGLAGAPRVAEDADLEHLIDVSVTTDLPVVIVNRAGDAVGIVTKARLLAGIRGNA